MYIAGTGHKLTAGHLTFAGTDEMRKTEFMYSHSKWDQGWLCFLFNLNQISL